MDRRIEKTKKTIYCALISLMSEKDFSSITINEIANRADVNRGTIYFHFQDKYELLDKCVEAQIYQLLQDCSIGTPETLMLNTFNYLKENSDVFKVLLENNGASAFRNHFQEMMLSHFGLHGDFSKSSSKRVSNEIRNRFIVSAVVGVLDWWITESMPYSPEEMVENFNTLFKNLLQP